MIYSNDIYLPKVMECNFLYNKNRIVNAKNIRNYKNEKRGP